MNREHQQHTVRFITVASGAGRAECSCGWRSRVSDDGDMFMDDYYSRADVSRDAAIHVEEQTTDGEAR